MTLFQTDAPVEQLSNWRTSHLPTPLKSRYVPLRAGILNVWEYDDQQFWFTDGRLLLRGRNEAGKSKVLELLFPFVLDGDISPKKLDPFDTANKSMWWNVIGFHKDRATAIGYLWLEFGRLDESGPPEYLTAIVGVQGTRAERKVNTWFALTPQRVDVDLDLAPGEVCRTQDSFAKALGPSALFETRAGAHRANVASRLFAMSPERFDNLLHLVRQLRKPKLADKLNNEKLSTVLTNALPPLDEGRIEPLAAGFAFLDADISDLAKADEAFRATGAFLDVYRAYARGQVRHRADQVRSAITRFDDVTKDEAAARATLEEVRARYERLTEESKDLARRHAAASGSLAGLDLSAVESLRSLEQQAAAHAEIAEKAFEEARRARTLAGSAARRLQDADGSLRQLRQAEADVLGATRRAAERAGVHSGWETVAGTDPVQAAGMLLDAARARRALVDAVAAADARAGRARECLAGTAAKVEQAAERADEAADAAAAAVAATARARTEFVDEVDTWLRAGPRDPVPVDAESVADGVAADLMGGDREARRVALAHAGDALDAAEQAVSVATVDLAYARSRHEGAVADLAAHDALADDVPPPARPGIPDARVGAPLWLAVEFTDAVTPDEAALLEAALAAAGLLDAAVTPAGLVSDADDTVLVPAGAAGRGVRDWIRPAVGADADLVDAVLGGIGVGADAGTTCWVDLDGSWANGPLQGRWTKAAAEHIGAAARAAARARRRTELEVAVESTRVELQRAEAGLGGAEEARRVARAWSEAFPSVTRWAAADREEARTASEAARDAGEHVRAVEAHEREVAANRQALEALDAAVAVAGCEPVEVAATRELLNAAGDAAEDLRSAARDSARSAGDVRRLQEEAEEAGAAGDAAEERHQTAAVAASRSDAAYRTVVELQGADVERILAEKDRLEQEVRALDLRRQQVETDRRAAREEEIRAEVVLQETGRRREHASSERELALVGLAALVRSGHVSHAVVVDVSRDATDYLQPTAGRTLARQVAAAVPDAVGSDEARAAATDRLVAAFTPLRDAIGAAFDPHLDSTEAGVFTASATLNGEVTGFVELHQALGEDVEQRRQTIAAEERNLIEQYLRDEVGNHLGDCLHAASTEVQQMNAILRRHPTNSGATVQLKWQVSEAAGSGVKEAVQALLTSPATRGEEASAALAVFLAERVAMARRGEVDGADLAERLTAALDYRHWYTFGVTYKAGGQEAALTARSVGSGSGGQQAKVAHLPLLAAAAGFYSSSPSAPRLCFLDEAFAGIDGPNTADLLEVATTLDLDLVMTNFDAWFCVPQLPGLAIYHLEKLAGAVGVAAIRYQWDGHTQTESDPWLES